MLITIPYMREHWTPLFEIAEISYMVDSMEQMVVILRRRDDGGSTAPGYLSA